MNPRDAMNGDFQSLEETLNGLFQSLEISANDTEIAPVFLAP
jgi:hypothetical protein